MNTLPPPQTFRAVTSQQNALGPPSVASCEQHTALLSLTTGLVFSGMSRMCQAAKRAQNDIFPVILMLFPEGSVEGPSQLLWANSHAQVRESR